VSAVGDRAGGAGTLRDEVRPRGRQPIRRVHDVRPAEPVTPRFESLFRGFSTIGE
jgi:hypothetical protein